MEDEGDVAPATVMEGGEDRLNLDDDFDDQGEPGAFG